MKHPIPGSQHDYKVYFYIDYHRIRLYYFERMKGCIDAFFEEPEEQNNLESAISSLDSDFSYEEDFLPYEDEPTSPTKEFADTKHSHESIDQDSQSENDGISEDGPSWCECGNCCKMPLNIENQCCKRHLYQNT